MKVVPKAQSDVISAEGITDNMTVVAKIHGNSCLLTQEGFSSGRWVWLSIDDESLLGNGYDNLLGYEYTLEEAINRSFDTWHEIEIHAFENWKEALVWLIDNAKDI